MTRLLLQPVIPIWLIVLLLLAGGAGLWLSSRRCQLSQTHRLALFGVRLAALLLLGALLLQPELLRVTERQEKPTVAILIDASASMVDAPGDDHQVRASNLHQILASRPVRALADRYRVEFFEFGADLQPRSPPTRETLLFNAPRTHLTDAVNALAHRLRGTNLAATIVLTDGLDQATAELSPDARRVPLLIPELAKPPVAVPTAAADTWIDAVNHPKLLVVNWQAQVEVTVRRAGAGQSVCPVHLYQRGERIRTAYATFQGEETMQVVAFTIEPTVVGRTTYRVDLEPPADLNPDNNTRQFVIDVTDPRNRVLYLEGAPRWEFKFLKRALQKEQNYSISAFVQGGDGVFINFTEGSDTAALGALPEFTPERLADYRVIILGELPATALTAAQQQALRTYVDNGGGLLFLGGRLAYGPTGWPAAEPLAPLLPFTNQEQARLADGRLPVAIATAGRTHPILASLVDEAALPPLLSVWGPVTARPGATPLLELTGGAPVVLVQPFGRGKVAAILSDSLWRWQLGAGAGDGQQKGLYDRFISQLVYWLSPQAAQVNKTATLQLFTAGGEAELRQRVAIGAVFGESTGERAGVTLTCTVTLPDQRQLTLPMANAKLGAEVGLEQALWGWRAEFTPPLPGEYRLQVTEAATQATQETTLLVAEPQLEITGQPIDAAYLTRLAAATGGRFFPLEETPQLTTAIPYQPQVLRTPTQTPLWNRPWLLVVLLALFIGEWYLRSKLDLV